MSFCARHEFGTPGAGTGAKQPSEFKQRDCRSECQGASTSRQATHEGLNLLSMKRFMMELFPTPESPSIRMRSETLGSAAAISEGRLEWRSGLARGRPDQRALAGPGEGKEVLVLRAHEPRVHARRTVTSGGFPRLGGNPISSVRIALPENTVVNSPRGASWHSQPESRS